MEPTPTTAGNKGAANLASSRTCMPPDGHHLGTAPGSQVMVASCGAFNRPPTLNNSSSTTGMPTAQGGEGSFALHAFRSALPPLLGPLGGQCATFVLADDMSDQSDDAVASPSEFSHYFTTTDSPHPIVATTTSEDFDPDENVCKTLDTGHVDMAKTEM